MTGPLALALLSLLVLAFTGIEAQDHSLGAQRRHLQSLSSASSSDDGDEGVWLTVTFIYVGPIGDYGYNYAYDLARLAVMVKFSYNVWCYYQTVNTSDLNGTLNIISNAASSSNLVITTSSDLRDPTNQVAQYFPQTKFLMAGGDSNLTNVGIYQTVYNDARFLTGVLAGMKTTTNKICFLCAYRLNYLINGFNAWVWGAKQYNENVTAMIAFVNSWSDPTSEVQAVNDMMDAGCDVVNGQVNDISWQYQVASRGGLSIGFNSDIRLLVGESVLTSVVDDFTDIFAGYFEEIKNDTFTPGVKFFNMANKMVELTDYGINVTFRERQIMANKWMNYTETHTDTFFCGPMYSSKICNITDCYPYNSTILPNNDTCLGNWNLTLFEPFLLEGVVDFGTISVASNSSGGSGVLIIHQGLSTGVIVGMVFGIIVGVIIVVGFVGYYARNQKLATISVLKQVEEGQKKNYKIVYNELKFHDKIGAGNFGEVYAGEYRGADVAIKKLKFQDLQRHQIEEFTQEVSVMVGLRHPNIVLLMGACNEPPNLCIVTEYMPQGSLYSVIHNERLQFNESMMKNMIVDMLKGLQFIHSAGLLHRDLKSPNLLVDKRGSLKLADFGLTILQTASTNSMVHVSVPWSAPEILTGQPFTAKADVYSVGIIFWEILTRLTPYHDMLPAAIPRAVTQGKRPEPTPNNSVLPGLVPILQSCWADSPAERPDVAEIRRAVEAIEVTPEAHMTHSQSSGSLINSGQAPRSGANTKNSDSSSTSSSTISIVLPKTVAPTGIVTCVFVDVPDSNALWEWDAHVMFKALTTFHQCIELLLFKHRGYMAKNDGDAYLLTFSEAVDGLNFVVDIHLELMKQDWPNKLLSHSEAQEENYGNGMVWRGLRARAAVHMGPVISAQGNIVEQVMYSGNVVDVAVKVARLAQPGQSLLTDVMRKLLASTGSRLLNSATVTDLNTKPVKIHQISHNSLLTREFTPSFNFFDESAPIIADNDLLSKPERWIIQMKDIRLGPQIGVGSFGETFLANFEGKDVAVKVFPIRYLKSAQQLELREEAVKLTKLSHPNVVRVYGICLQVPILAMVQDFLPRGSLQHIVATNTVELPWERRLSFAIGIASGMAYLHSKNILHTEVKPSNFLVGHDWQIKVADLGFSRIKSQHQTMTHSELVAWTAPEVFDGEVYTKHSEVYSFAIILWEMVTRQVAWEGMHALRIANLVSQGQRPSVSGIVSNHMIAKELLRIMIQCWAPRREERPTFEQIVEMLQNLT